jgi:hypothetical protein
MGAKQGCVTKKSAICALVVAFVAMALSAGPASAKLPHVVYVTSVSLSKTAVAPGASVEVTHRVRNRGRRESGRRTVRFYLTLTEDAARGLKGASLGTSKTSRIPSETTKTFRKTLTIPANTPGGAYLVTACISGECQATTVRIVVAGPPVPPFGDAQLVISPSPYDYGEHTFESVTENNFTVTNVGSQPSGAVTMFLVDVIKGGGAQDFSIVEDGCTGATLAPFQSCIATVTYTAATGTSTAALGPSATPGAPGFSVNSNISGTGPACFRARGDFEPTPRC